MAAMEREHANKQGDGTVLSKRESESFLLSWSYVISNFRKTRLPFKLTSQLPKLLQAGAGPPPPTNLFPRFPGVLCSSANPSFPQARGTGLHGCSLSSHCACPRVEAPPPSPSCLLLGMCPEEEFPLYCSVPPPSNPWGMDQWFPGKCVKL